MSKPLKLEDLKAEFPEGITRLLEIPGIGPKTAYRLANELRITSAEQLEQAILEGKTIFVRWKAWRAVFNFRKGMCQQEPHAKKSKRHREQDGNKP